MAQKVTEADTLYILGSGTLSPLNSDTTLTTTLLGKRQVQRDRKELRKAGSPGTRKVFASMTSRHIL